MAKEYDYIKELQKLLGIPIENICISFFDDFIQNNAEFRTRAGLKEYIIRTELAKCCKWCHDLAGTYEYTPTMDTEVFRKHDNCRCLVVHSTQKGNFKDVWSKKEFSTLTEARNDRIKMLKNVAIPRRNGIINQGGLLGALNDENDPWNRKRDEHAARYYTAIKNSNADLIIETISQNTGIDKEIVTKMFKHLFVEKYDLSGEFKTFDPSYDIAQSVQRLREGKNIQKHDIVLIHHEAEEYEIMKKQNLSYKEAHELANRKYSYVLELKKWTAPSRGD